MVKKADKDGFTPLFRASEKGYVEVVELLLLAAGVDVNKADTKNGTTPLLISSQNGHAEVVQLLLAAGADANKAETTNNRTPLLVASQNGHLKVVTYLLDARADVSVMVDINGEAYTALKLAKLNGSEKIVELLKKHGAKE